VGNIRSIKSFIFLALLVFFTSSTNVMADDIVYAGSMAFKSNGSGHDGNGWVLSSNGYVGTFIDVEIAGSVIITIRADGSIAGGTLPIMDLHVGDFNDTWSVADNGSPHNIYNDYVAVFNLPVGMHAVRVEFVNDYTISGDRNLYLKRVTFSGATLENDASSDNALSTADNYIDKYRKGKAKVTVTIEDANVPEGTPVQVELINHAYNFGAAVYGHSSVPSWTLPNPTPGSDNYNYQQFLDSHFNMIVPENSGKWENNESTRDVVTMNAVDAILDYAETHGHRARMHCAFWDNQQPSWVDTLKNQAISDPCGPKPAEYWDEMMERIDYYIADRAHRLTDIDGINESYHKDMHTQIYGIDGVADIYNEMVAASAGQAKIAVNEYGVLEYGGYTNWYREHIEEIINAGGIVELIGLQNYTSSYGYDAVGVFQNLQLFAGFELPMIITEFALESDSPVPSILTETMRFCFGNDMTDGFVMWGFWDHPNWMWKNGSALVDDNWNLTDCGVAYEQLMAQWDTDEIVYVDSNSQIEFTGFYGEYNLTVDGQSYSFTFVKGEGVSEPVFRVLYVDDDAPGDPAPGNPDTSDPNENGTPDHPFDAIQEAIDTAVYRDTILVLDGTYTGEGNRDITYGGEAMTVKSQNGPEMCIIDCQGTTLAPHIGFIFIDGEDGNSVLDGFTITNGYGHDNGGAIRCDNGSSPIIRNCILVGNVSSAPGGAIGCSYECGPTVDNCRISGNTSPFGGAIYCEESSLVLRNCLLADNSADDWGGGVCSVDSNPTIKNCTFSNNTADYGGGLCIRDYATATLSNCILWANTASTGPQLAIGGINVTVSVLYSDLEGGESAVDVGAGCVLIWDPNNIELDPNLVSVGHPDANQRDYHLLPKSPCIDSGDPAGSHVGQSDIDGNSRVIAGRIDMGADEFTCVGDLDYDSTVNLSDFTVFGAYWRETGCSGWVGCVKADLDRNTDVNLEDLQLFIQNWLVMVP